MQIGDRPRFRLAHAPTPLEHLPRISATLGGPDIYIKRDDCTGLAFGGNKTRKLEFLIGDALARGATDIITEGGLQSNHIRQTAAACAKAGLSCHLVVNRNVPIDTPDYQASGNLLLDYLLGATVHLCAQGEERSARIAALVARLGAEGRKPYHIPTGGSNAIGSIGYAVLALEIVMQANERALKFDNLVVASGSGGTQAGLVAGLHGASAGLHVVGVDIDHELEHVTELVTRLTHESAALLGLSPVPAAAIELAGGHAAPAYGLPNDAMIAAVKLMARTEGILLDPVYSGKAFAGLIAMIGQGRFKKGEKVLFVHTGGGPGLFAYRNLFGPEAR